jgi:molecular chaperone GrpE (heat shock protein)
MKTESPNPPVAELDASATTVETAGTESEALVKDLAEQKDLHLRLAADFENFKKRSRQESRGPRGGAKGIVHR